MGSAAAYALVVGALSLRTRGVYFIMVTLAFAQMAFFVFHDTALGGGSDGIYMNIQPDARRCSTWRTRASVLLRAGRAGAAPRPARR